MPRIRRSSHFVPGANQRMLEKSLELPADSVVLDLEDAVTPDHKEAAREVVAGWLRDVDFGGRERVVRINPLDSRWGRDDLAATVAHPPDAYLIPKVSAPDEVLEVDRMLGEAGLPPEQVRLLVLGTETPAGLLRIRELTACGRVDALTWGAEDLSAAIGARRNRDENGEYLEIFRYARLMTVLAATAAGVQPLDTVYVDFKNLDGLRRECRSAAEMGFTGKMTIHPSQVEVVNEAFTPSEEEIELSRALLEANEEARAAGKGAFRFRGSMVDVPHVTRARQILELARHVGVAD